MYIPHTPEEIISNTHTWSSMQSSFVWQVTTYVKRNGWF